MPTVTDDVTSAVGARLAAGPLVPDEEALEEPGPEVPELEPGPLLDVEDEGGFSPLLEQPAKARAVTMRRTAKTRIQGALRTRSYLSSLAGSSERRAVLRSGPR